MAEESLARPFYTVLILALVCSALVAGAAVGLRPLQEANRQLDQKKNILRAAGLYDAKGDVQDQFKAVQIRIVDLTRGEFIAEGRMSLAEFNQNKAALDPALSTSLTKEEDLARLSRRENFSLVYLVKKDNRIDQIILPVRGKGLWSTMYAYVALDGDLTTIRGISFYAHGETPGLGGEIENPAWQKAWHGKEVYGSAQQVALRVTKGKSAATGEAALHQIDGLSGATMTGAGVSNLLRFWFGEHGFQPFLQHLQQKGGLNG